MEMERATPRRGRQGFASMDQARQREIASKGGSSVPPEKRPFARSHALAAEAGRKGGQATKSPPRGRAEPATGLGKAPEVCATRET